MDKQSSKFFRMLRPIIVKGFHSHEESEFVITSAAYDPLCHNKRIIWLHLEITFKCIGERIFIIQFLFRPA